MNWSSKISLDLQDSKRIHKAWKSRMHNFLQSLPTGKINRQERNETSPLDESLETLLSQKCGQIAFRDFLKSEFCEENLDFWLACQEFQTFDSPEELTQRAASIYEEFVSTESPKQVNLDFYTRKIIRQSLQQPSPSCFVVAQKKIYSLMENDSFLRFTQSKQYQVLLAAAPKQRGLGKHRKALKIRRSNAAWFKTNHFADLCTRTDIMHINGAKCCTDTGSGTAVDRHCAGNSPSLRILLLNNITSDRTSGCARAIDIIYCRRCLLVHNEHWTSPKVLLWFSVSWGVWLRQPMLWM